MIAMRIVLYAFVALLAFNATSRAQAPCYTPDACRQVRLQAEQYEQQQAAMRAAEQERQRQAMLAEQRRAEAERREAMRRAAEARQRAEDRAAAQLAAESSPTNYCKDRQFAGNLIKEFNGLAYRPGIEAVDIEHLTTIRFDADAQSVICHGDFMLTNGRRLSGTVSIRPNVAGDMIIHWQPD